MIRSRTLRISIVVGGVVTLLLLSTVGKIAPVIGAVVSIVVYRWFSKRKKSEPEQKTLETKNRMLSHFSVIPDGITVNGKFYKKADIHRIVIKNHVHDAQEGQVVFSAGHSGNFGSALAAGAHNAGVEMRLAWEKKLAEVSYLVQFESGGVAHILAGGLSEPCAFAIQADVAAIIDFK